MTTVVVEGRQLELTNLEKVLWPDVGFTKRELIEYYVDLAPLLLPHLEGRPLTLRRFPDGVGGVSWHQNECQRQPPWFPVFETTGRGGRPLRFCMVDGEAALVWLANQAAVELHPFSWRADAPRVPTQLVFDLDRGGRPDAWSTVEAPRDHVPRTHLEEHHPCARGRRLGRHRRDQLAAVAEAAPVGMHRDVQEVHLVGHAPAAGVAHHRARVCVDRDGQALADVVRQLQIVLDRLQGRGIAVQPDMPDPRRGDEVEEAVRTRRGELLVVTEADIRGRVEQHGDVFAAIA